MAFRRRGRKRGLNLKIGDINFKKDDNSQRKYFEDEENIDYFLQR